MCLVCGARFGDCDHILLSYDPYEQRAVAGIAMEAFNKKVADIIGDGSRPEEKVRQRIRKVLWFVEDWSDAVIGVNFDGGPGMSSFCKVYLSEYITGHEKEFRKAFANRRMRLYMTAQRHADEAKRQAKEEEERRLEAEKERENRERWAKLSPRPEVVEEALRRRCAEDGIDIASEEAGRLREMFLELEKALLSCGVQWGAFELSALEFKDVEKHIIRSRINGTEIFRWNEWKVRWESAGNGSLAAHPRMTEDDYWKWSGSTWF
ncbi:hypothetical protein [Sutterella sp.]|uniref:hypothetical protein n=1 Tax=Sutterella sp. TaxID=1981025 RepID=UPI0026DF2100|nr:hypothetical protein [Sutterella sp.]MDO5532810.1 hypothetical protein [Sutterella sp.]